MQEKFIAALETECLKDFAPVCFRFLKICQDSGCGVRQKKIENACLCFGEVAVPWREIFGLPWPRRTSGEPVPLEIQIVLDAAFEYYTAPSPSSWRALVRAADQYREANTPC